MRVCRVRRSPGPERGRVADSQRCAGSARMLRSIMDAGGARYMRWVEISQKLRISDMHLARQLYA